MRMHFFMLGRAFFGLCVVATLSGCATSRVTQTTTPLVSLQNGGTSSIRVVQNAGTSEPGTGPLALWKTPDGDTKTLVTLVPAPGSPAPLLRLDSSTPRYSSDG